jgi:hypothetical protein
MVNVAPDDDICDDRSIKGNVLLSVVVSLSMHLFVCRGNNWGRRSVDAVHLRV